jgi:U3 small nucleolar RNA-associated protein 21
MALFHPFRALGYITTATPFAVQRRGGATFLTVSAGRSWQTYSCAKLTLLFVGQPARPGAVRKATV